MDKSELYYKIINNKSRILSIISVLFVLSVVAIGVFVIRKNNSYQVFDSTSSKKYVLASNIISANSNGDINLYNTTNGKIVDSLSLTGSYIFDSSDDLKKMYMLNVGNGDFYTISSENDKLIQKREDFKINSDELFDSFDYDNNSAVILTDDKKSFLIKPSDSNELKRFTPDITSDIDLFRIVKNNLIFTSGEFIYSKSLSQNISESESFKVTQTNLELRDKENIYGNIITEVPAGERVEIVKEGDTGWYLVKYNNLEGYVPNTFTNFKEVSNEDSGVLKIHIGEGSNFIHELGDRLFIHNDFGKNRGGSILLEINPENLYIENLVEYKNPTNSFISNIDDSRFYTNELVEVDGDKTRQIIKFKDIDDTDDRLGFKYTSETILGNYNSYGTFGYIYYRDEKGINIFNLKSQEKDLTIKTDDDFFMPSY